MPKGSRQTASDSIDGQGFEGHYEDFEGGYTVGFETFTENVDMTPRLRGLPGDSCPSAHWGYVLKGKLTYKMRDHDEVLEGGDAFYVPPEHTLMRTQAPRSSSSAPAPSGTKRPRESLSCRRALASSWPHTERSAHRPWRDIGGAHQGAGVR